MQALLVAEGEVADGVVECAGELGFSGLAPGGAAFVVDAEEEVADEVFGGVEAALDEEELFAAGGECEDAGGAADVGRGIFVYEDDGAGLDGGAGVVGPDHFTVVVAGVGAAGGALAAAVSIAGVVGV